MALGRGHGRLPDEGASDGYAIENASPFLTDVDYAIILVSHQRPVEHTGAEAIAVNDQRLTATSTIRKAGGAILVDFRAVACPYEIRVIGPGDLEDRFADSAAACADEQGRRRRASMGFDARREDDLNLPAATEPQLNYATRPASPSATPTPGTSSSSPVRRRLDDPRTRPRRGCRPRSGVRPDRARLAGALPPNTRWSRRLLAPLTVLLSSQQPFSHDVNQQSIGLLLSHSSKFHNTNRLSSQLCT